jgi:hypothetical protein
MDHQVEFSPIVTVEVALQYIEREEEQMDEGARDPEIHAAIATLRRWIARSAPFSYRSNANER